MKKIIYLFFPVFLLVLSACSRTEYFVIVNRTGNDITIVYNLQDHINRDNIFSEDPEMYYVNDVNEIDWDKNTVDYSDTDTTKTGVKLIVKPNSILKFGTLMNDNYSSSDQEFINDIQFNLLYLSVLTIDSIIYISKESFDNYFTKERGYIKMIIH